MSTLLSIGNTTIPGDRAIATLQQEASLLESRLAFLESKAALSPRSAAAYRAFIDNRKALIIWLQDANRLAN